MRRRVRLNIIETETQGMDGRPQGIASTDQFQRWLIPNNYELRITHYELKRGCIIDTSSFMLKIKLITVFSL